MVPSFFGTIWSPELQGESEHLQIPAAHITSKYFFATLNFSGINRLGDVVTGGGPDVLMKHSTPCRVVLDARAICAEKRTENSRR